MAVWGQSSQRRVPLIPRLPGMSDVIWLQSNVDVSGWKAAAETGCVIVLHNSEGLELLRFLLCLSTQTQKKT